MKKVTILASVLLLSVIMWSCDDSFEASKIWIELRKSSPTKTHATVNGGGKAVYDIHAESTEGPLTSFKIYSVDPTNGRVEQVNETPMIKKYNYSYTHDVPVFEKEPEKVTITMIAVDSEGNEFTNTCRLTVMLPGTAIDPTGE